VTINKRQGDVQGDRFGAEVEPVVRLVAVRDANEPEGPVFVGPLVDAHELAALVRRGRPEIDTTIISGHVYFIVLDHPLFPMRVTIRPAQRGDGTGACR
jgi:hypothetical protein